MRNVKMNFLHLHLNYLQAKEQIRKYINITSCVIFFWDNSTPKLYLQHHMYVYRLTSYATELDRMITMDELRALIAINTDALGYSRLEGQ